MIDKTLLKLLKLCANYYTINQFEHALSVAEYAYDMAQTNNELSGGYGVKDIYYVGLAHDLLEDTLCTKEELENIIGQNLLEAVCLLTNESVSYNDYIDGILSSGNLYAIIVKKADMKDHLMRYDTLTDRLKEKYLPVIGKLM